MKDRTKITSVNEKGLSVTTDIDVQQKVFWCATLAETAMVAAVSCPLLPISRYSPFCSPPVAIEGAYNSLQRGS
ncbi:hypothetical protein AMATHDRAFT_72003 [Amanita thiersii Skay4041]|uniref:Uncharacterized protein n=1 Tax=Amanita thiersii Skay4041 TaxID=703135 RepID=A0A2A9N615_9AGAR|nr:hypothetical protein AMATHDRAFT_72003 [Amanita thiersii Skay4041]